MNVVRMMPGVVSLNKALSLCRVYKKARYYTLKPRDIPPDPEVWEIVKRSTCGTRRMVTQVSRELHRPVNRKVIRSIFSIQG